MPGFGFGFGLGRRRLARQAPPQVPGVERFRLNFATGTHTLNGAPITLDQAIVTTRTSVRTAMNSSGVYSSVAAGVPGVTNLGIIVEPTRQNVVRWSRDLTNALWVKTSATVAKDQVGIDGTPASASRMTATADGATVLQSITATASNRWPSFFLRRLAGTGTLTATIDGVNFYPVVRIEGDRHFIAFPSVTYWQNITNPVIGWKMQSSGDAWAVDGVQLENASIGPSTPIHTTTAAVSRAAETIALSDALRTTMTLRRGTLLATVRNLQSIAAIGTYPQVINARFDAQNKVGIEIGTGPLADGTDSALAKYLQAFLPYKDGLFIQKVYSQGTCDYDRAYKIAAAWGEGAAQGAFSNGATGTLSQGAGAFDDTPPVFVGIGNNNGGQHGSMYISEIAYYDGPIPQAALDAYVS